MRIYLLLLLVLVTLSTTAKERSWEVSTEGTIGLTPCYNVSGNQKYRAAIGMYESFRFNGVYYFNKYLGAGIGVMLHAYKYETDVVAIPAIVYKQQRNYISVPFFLSAELKGKRNRIWPYARAGFTYCRLITAKYRFRTEYSGSSVGSYGSLNDDKADFKNNVLLAAFATGLNFPLSKRTYIDLGFEDSFAITPVQENPHNIVPTRTGGMGEFSLHLGLHLAL